MKPIRGGWVLTLDTGGRKGELVSLTCGGRNVVRVWADEAGIHAEIVTHWADSMKKFGHDDDLIFRLDAPNAGDAVRLEWREYSARLYDGDVPVDEDWVLGEIIGDDWTLTASVNAELRETDMFEPDAPTAFEGTAQYYSPPGHNAHIGDCMPFEYGGAYHLFCLYDRRHHGSKKGLGAHQWAHLSTKDMKRWTWHPIAVGIDEQWEGSICTGSLIEKDGKVYAFYAARMSDGSPARLTCAVSEDCVHFKKTGIFFSLTAPYEPTSARDPKLWRDADGVYHMMVTTSLVGVKRGGCLAHLTSADLESWVQREPMIVPGYDDQPECSDYFEMNGLYYLVFSNHLGAHYLVSEQPFGPWRRLREDVLDTAGSRVPKTACFGGKRLVTGWVTEGPWGGCPVTHELIQRADGTLGTRLIDELLPGDMKRLIVSDAAVSAEKGSGSALLLTADERYITAFHVKPEADNAAYGLELTGTNGETVRLELDGAAETACLTAVSGSETLTRAVWSQTGFEMRLAVSEGAVEFELPDDHIMMAGHTLTAPYTLEIYARCPVKVSSRGRA